MVVVIMEGREGTDDVPTGFEVEVGAKVDIYRIPSPCVLVS